MVSRFYLRVQVADEPGALAAIAGVFGQEGVSIHSMQQIGEEDSAQLVLVLHPVREAAFFGALARIACIDAFIDALQAIADEVEQYPQFVLKAPYTALVTRLDEVGAARNPSLSWKPKLREDTYA